MRDFIWGKFRQPVPGKPHYFFRDGSWWVYKRRGEDAEAARRRRGA